MLVRFFRASRVQELFVLPLVALLLRLPAFWIHQPVETYASPWGFAQHVVNGINAYPVLAILLSGLLVASQGLLLNRLIEKYALLKRLNYLTAFFFVVLNSIWPFQMGIYPGLIANLFLLWALDKSLAISQSDRVNSLAFDAALIIGFASLIAPLYSIALAALVLSQLFFNGWSWRSPILIALGTSTPFLLLYNASYLLDANYVHLAGLLNWSFNALASTINPQISLYYLPLSAILLAVLVSLNSYLKGIRVNTVRTRNILLLFLLFVPMVPAAGFVFNSQFYSVYGLLSLPLCMILANYALYSRKTWIPELLSWLLLGSSLFTSMGLLLR